MSALILLALTIILPLIAAIWATIQTRKDKRNSELTAGKNAAQENLLRELEELASRVDSYELDENSLRLIDERTKVIVEKLEALDKPKKRI